MGIMPDIMETGRLRLHRITEERYPRLIELIADPETNRHLSWRNRDAELVTADLRDYQEHWRRRGFGYWAVEEITTGELVGIGGVQTKQWESWPALNLYARFAPSTWGTGYATEMSLAAVEWAGQHLPDEPVVGVTTIGNTSSRRLMERLGMIHRETVTNDGQEMLLYSR
ncbi:N-acetyltransferase [Pseudonocardiaceae bacterium YIM PH 21723]|nr:N-acetyltransferase [Pseudonocardiaceae bacterium YIM PH 21723]